MKSQIIMIGTALIIIIAAILTSISPAPHIIAELENETTQENQTINQTENTTIYLEWNSPEPEDNTKKTYSQSVTHKFHTTWASSEGIEYVEIKHNFTGTQQETNTSSIGNGIYEYEHTGIPAGTYAWSMNARDIEGNQNETPEHKYIVEKATPNITLKINGEENNAEITPESKANITATLLEGEGIIELIINGETKQSSNNTITITQQFNETQTHTIKARYNETQNYTGKEIILEINVKPLALELAVHPEHNIGQSSNYAVNAPQGATVTVTNYGPKETMIGSFAECLKTTTLTGPYPSQHPIPCTNISGEYILNATMNYNGATISKQTTYKVENSISLTIIGETTKATGTEITLNGAAGGGISPYTYTWTLPSGEKKESQEIKVKYDTPGARTLTLEVKDAAGNKKTQTTEISVRNKHKLTIEVKSKDTGSVIDGARIRAGPETNYTGSSGKATLELYQDSYEASIFYSGYKEHRQSVDLDRDKSITVQLEKTEVQPASTARITLQSPEDKSTVSSPVTMQASTNIGQNAECKIYLAEKGSEWYEEVASKNITSNDNTVMYIHQLEPKEYKWRVECKTSTGTTHTSNDWEFTVEGEEGLTAITLAQTEESIDAGELRRKIEAALDNMASLDFESRKASDALGIKTAVDRALRDYERILRDINSMRFRRDLTDAQIQERISEMHDVLRKLELETPSNIKTSRIQSFVSYPQRNELRDISSKYSEAQNIAGRLDESSLQELQNKIMVKTDAMHAEITLMTGETKRVTIISKEINVTGETRSAHFLLESIPETLAGSADEINFISEHTVVSSNPLVRFPLGDRIVYYVEGHKDLELAEEAYTLLFSNSVFTTSGGRNTITGFVTLPSVQFTSTTWLVILLIIIILAYIAYIFDLLDYAKELIGRLSYKRKIHELRMMINDSQDYLAAGNLERAHLIFKEVRFSYEKASLKVRKEVYEDAMKALSALNEKYVSDLFESLTKAVGENRKDIAVQEYNKLVKAYKASGAELREAIRQRINEAKRRITDRFPEMQQ